MNALLRRAWEALFPIPKVSQVEAFLTRVFLAAILHRFLPIGMEQVTQPVPVGLAHFVNLTWLANPQAYAVYHFVFLMAVFIYASGLMLHVTLPVLTLLQLLPFTLLNSQGHPHHGYQIISLAMLGMSVMAVVQWLKGNGQPWAGLGRSVMVKALAAVAVLVLGWFMAVNGPCDVLARRLGAPFGEGGPGWAYSLIRITVFLVLSWPLARLAAKDRPSGIMNASLLMAAQFMIAGAYLVSVCSKMRMSKGQWLLNSHYVALDFVKTTRQSYYSALDPKFAHDPAGVVFLMSHETLARLFFGGGVVLETILIVAVGTRWLALALGVALVIMHSTIQELMTLSFPTNEYMDTLFFINVPFLVALAVLKMQGKKRLGEA